MTLRLVFATTGRATPAAAALIAALACDQASAQDQVATYGEWRGPAQYHASIGGVTDTTAHAVANLTIEVDPGGKVRGASNESGCRLLGLATRGVMPTIANLDVTFSQCQNPKFNRRFIGTLAHYPKDRRAELQITSMSSPIGKVEAFEVKASLRR